MISQKALKATMPFCQPFSTATPSGRNDAKAPASVKTVFSDESTFSLANKYLVYQMCRFPFLIKNARLLTNVFSKVLGKKFVNYVLEKTMGKVFTAGCTLNDLSRDMEKLAQKKVYSVADLSIEDVGNLPKEYLDANKQQNVSLLNTVASDPRQTMALKVTSFTYLWVLKEFNVGQKRLYDMFVDIAGPGLDASITKAQVKEYVKKKFNIDASDAEIDQFFKVGKLDSKDTNADRLTAAEYTMNIHAYPIYAPLKNSLATKIAGYRPELIAQLDDWLSRVNSILDEIKKANAYCMIDAEQTYIQYGIDSVAKQLQRIHNKSRTMIMNTYQSYLKRTQRDMSLDVLGCRMVGQCFGAKLVRGAYVTEENKIALDQGIESPIFPNKPLVDKSYNGTMEFVIGQMPANSHFTVASHNDETVDIALGAMTKRGKELNDQNIKISFAQLKGLGDRLTFGLADQGHHTFKYLPYGPIHNLVPYLFRRAEEASYIWTEGQKKLVDIRKELFEIRKFHYKAGAAAGGLALLLLIL